MEGREDAINVVVGGAAPKSNKCASARTDPSEYFQGALQRPRLEILSPENGEVLDSGNLDIRMSSVRRPLKQRPQFRAHVGAARFC